MTQSTPKSGRLTKPAWVGNTSFAAGVDEQLVIDRAQREYEYQQQPEQVAARLAKFSDFQSRLASHAEPAASDGLAEVERILATIPDAPTDSKWREKDMAYLPSEMRTLRDYIIQLRSRPAQGDPFADKYHELLLAVGMKWPGESRHETALRYIRNAERPQQGADAAMSDRSLKTKEKGDG